MSLQLSFRICLTNSTILYVAVIEHWVKKYIEKTEFYFCLTINDQIKFRHKFLYFLYSKSLSQLTYVVIELSGLEPANALTTNPTYHSFPVC